MKLPRQQIKRTIRLARRVVMPREQAVLPQQIAAWAAAVATWERLYEPFGVLLDDADILELGCGDGRLLGGLVRTGAPRSAVGIDRRAFWTGEAGYAPWCPDELGDALQLYPGLPHLYALDEDGFDLILCRNLDESVALADLESVLQRLYRLLRPGGEALMRVHCANPTRLAFTAEGYGFLTPTAWKHLIMRAGFEIVRARPVMRAPEEAAELFAFMSATERETAELRLHLIRPWEAWELEGVTEQVQGPPKPKPNRRRVLST